MKGDGQKPEGREAKGVVKGETSKSWGRKGEADEGHEEAVAATVGLWQREERRAYAGNGVREMREVLRECRKMKDTAQKEGTDGVWAVWRKKGDGEYNKHSQILAGNTIISCPKIETLTSKFISDHWQIWVSKFEF